MFVIRPCPRIDTVICDNLFSAMLVTADFKFLKRCKCKGNPVMHIIRADGGKVKIRDGGAEVRRPGKETEARLREQAKSQQQQQQQQQQTFPLLSPSQPQPQQSSKPFYRVQTEGGDSADARPAFICIDFILPGVVRASFFVSCDLSCIHCMLLFYLANVLTDFLFVCLGPTDNNESCRT